MENQKREIEFLNNNFPKKCTKAKFQKTDISYK